METTIRVEFIWGYGKRKMEITGIIGVMQGLLGYIGVIGVRVITY